MSIDVDAWLSYLERRIITLNYRPGAYLNEAQICADLRIGRTPVHMALQRLSIDGMIEIMPRKGAIVRPVTVDEIMSVIEARLCNEPMAARLAAARASSAQIDRLTEIVAEADARTSEKDVEALMELDRELHSLIADATRNTVLARILKMLHEHSLRLWFISLSEPARLEKEAHEHGDILAAISAKDERRAELVMRQHIESFAQTITASISNFELGKA